MSISIIVDKRIQAIELLLSDARGIYIPRDFTQICDLKAWHIKGVKRALSKPENENYWDTWQHVLDNAYFTKDGYTWRLYQDGDLFAICDELMTDNEKLEFYGVNYL